MTTPACVFGCLAARMGQRHLQMKEAASLAHWWWLWKSLLLAEATAAYKTAMKVMLYLDTHWATLQLQGPLLPLAPPTPAAELCIFQHTGDLVRSSQAGNLLDGAEQAQFSPAFRGNCEKQTAAGQAACCLIKNLRASTCCYSVGWVWAHAHNNAVPPSLPDSI